MTVREYWQAKDWDRARALVKVLDKFKYSDFKFVKVRRPNGNAMVIADLKYHCKDIYFEVSPLDDNGNQFNIQIEDDDRPISWTITADGNISNVFETTLDEYKEHY